MMKTTETVRILDGKQPSNKPRASSGFLKATAVIILLLMLLVLTVFMTIDSTDMTFLLNFPGKVLNKFNAARNYDNNITMLQCFQP